MSTLRIVAGGGFGSEAKGAVSAYLSRPEENPDGMVAVRVAGSNAGHTVIDADGKAWRLRQVPVAAVVNPYAHLVLAAGSEISHDVLHLEIEELDEAGFNVSNRIHIDRSATMVEDIHEKAEQSTGLVERIGSTGKGIGAARADRIWRKADTFGGDFDAAEFIRDRSYEGSNTLIEGTQGYGLGLHTRFYPQVTSSDCRAIDFLAMAGLSPWDPAFDHVEPWLVFRTRPIRVAGNSGPLENETTWQELGLPEEHTTVTKKVRRVGEWDRDLAREAIIANGTRVKVALSMMDQLHPEIAGQVTMHPSEPASATLVQYENDLRTPISLVGTGPASMIDLR